MLFVQPALRIISRGVNLRLAVRIRRNQWASAADRAHSKRDAACAVCRYPQRPRSRIMSLHSGLLTATRSAALGTKQVRTRTHPSNLFQQVHARQRFQQTPGRSRRRG